MISGKMRNEIMGWRVWLCWTILIHSGPAAEWTAGTGFRSAPLSVPSVGKPGFVHLPASATGIVFTNRLSIDRYVTNQIYLNGAGVAAGDIDGDGLVDVYFCGLDNRNALYRNLGNWKFQDIT